MNTRKAVTGMLVVTLAIALPGWYIFGRTDQSIDRLRRFQLRRRNLRGKQGHRPRSRRRDGHVGGTSRNFCSSSDVDAQLRDLPADASAYVLNPSVISDRHHRTRPGLHRRRRR